MAGSSSEGEPRRDPNSGLVDQAGKATSSIPNNATKQVNKGGRVATNFDSKHSKRRRTRAIHKESGNRKEGRGRPLSGTKRSVKEAAKRTAHQKDTDDLQKLQELQTNYPDPEALKALLGSNTARSVYGPGLANLFTDTNVSNTVKTLFSGKENTIGRITSKAVIGMVSSALESTAQAAALFDMTPRFILKAKDQAKKISANEMCAIERKVIDKSIRAVRLAFKNAGPSKVDAFREELGKLNHQKQQLMDRVAATGIKSKHPVTIDYPVNTTKIGVCKFEAQIYLDFYEDNSTNKSGDNSSLRRMDLPGHEFLAKLHGEFPLRLRGLAQKNPALVQEIENTKIPNRFQSSLLSAVHAGDKDGFDEAKEISTRTALYFEHYLAGLHAKRVDTRNERADTDADLKTHHPIGSDADLDSPGPAADTCFYPREIVARTYWKVLATHGCRYTWNMNDTNCKMCDEHKATKLRMDRVVAKQATAAEQEEVLKAQIKAAEREIVDRNCVGKEPDQNGTEPELCDGNAPEQTGLDSQLSGGNDHSGEKEPDQNGTNPELCGGHAPDQTCLDSLLTVLRKQLTKVKEACSLLASS